MSEAESTVQPGRPEVTMGAEGPVGRAIAGKNKAMQASRGADIYEYWQVVRMET